MGSFPRTDPFGDYAPPVAGCGTMNGGMMEQLNLAGNTVTNDVSILNGSIQYRPFLIEATTTIRAISWLAGTSGTTNSVNVEFAIFTEAGVRLTTTGTVTVTAVTAGGTLQTAALTQVTLTPGAYYLAYLNLNGLGPNGGLNQLPIRGTPAFTLVKFRAMGFFEQTSATMPTTATFATYSNNPTVSCFVYNLLGRA